MERDARSEKKTVLATFASGCFWSKEYFFSRLPGVVSTRVGFTGGHTSSPTYKEVCTKTTGHAEAVELQFDPEHISYRQLLQTFFNRHNPEIDRRDRGGQYRSAIFFHNSSQHKQALEALGDLRRNGYQPVTEVKPAGSFWPADARHQKYCDSRNMQPEDRFVDRFVVKNQA